MIEAIVLFPLEYFGLRVKRNIGAFSLTLLFGFC